MLIAHGRWAALLTATLATWGALCVLGPQPLFAQRTAFYYGGEPPPELLQVYDRLVLHHQGSMDPTRLAQGSHAHLFAYVSLGEYAPKAAAPRAPDPAPGTLIARNKDWGTEVRDLGHPAWRRYLIDQVIATLWKRGYRGFFFDTLDSYHLARLDAAGQRRQQQGLIELIREVRRRFPGAELIANRGFEVIPQVRTLLCGVVAESLFKRWNTAKKIYDDVPAENREWLVKRLNEVKAMGLPVTVIDYVPPKRRKAARETARKIAALGFDPWVTDHDLSTVGVGDLEVVPRRVLFITDDKDALSANIAISRAVFTSLAPVLEYMGYIPEFQDVSDPLPHGELAGRYAGVISFFKTSHRSRGKEYAAWLTRQINSGVRVAILGDLGFDIESDLADVLGISLGPSLTSGSLRISKRGDLVGFEAQPRAHKLFSVPLILKGKGVDTHLQLADRAGHHVDAVATTRWGGLALFPFITETRPDGNFAWVLDPFKFLARALRLPLIPAPDVTTENGRRLLMVHIDGDGFMHRAKMPNTPYAAEVLYEKVLRVRAFPHSVSIIEAEVGPQGLYPELSPRLEVIARKIFRLPNVEIASHTYSHPFKWGAFARGVNTPETHLMIEGYQNSIEREILGSIDYIDRSLAPRQKKCKVFFWTGDTLVDQRALELLAKRGIKNLNGGMTNPSGQGASLAQITGLGRRVGPYLHVFAPNTNELGYIDPQRQPILGFDRVIGSFKYTDMPRRLKPVNLYYHFFSGSSLTGLGALNKVYDWIESRELFSVYASEYSERVEGYYGLTIARTLAGSYLIKGLGALRTLRIPKELGWPDLTSSPSVVALREIPQGRYLSVGPQPTALLTFRPSPPESPIISEANGRVLAFTVHSARHVSLQIKGHRPLQVTISNLTGRCQLQARGRRYPGIAQGSNRKFTLKITDTGSAEILCRGEEP